RKLEINYLEVIKQFTPECGIYYPRFVTNGMKDYYWHETEEVSNEVVKFISDNNAKTWEEAVENVCIKDMEAMGFSSRVTLDDYVKCRENVRIFNGLTDIVSKLDDQTRLHNKLFVDSWNETLEANLISFYKKMGVSEQIFREKILVLPAVT